MGGGHRRVELDRLPVVRLRLLLALVLHLRLRLLVHPLLLEGDAAVHVVHGVLPLVLLDLLAPLLDALERVDVRVHHVLSRQPRARALSLRAFQEQAAKLLRTSAPTRFSSAVIRSVRAAVSCAASSAAAAPASTPKSTMVKEQLQLPVVPAMPLRHRVL